MKRLLSAGFLFLFLSNVFPREQKTVPQCVIAILPISLKAGENYERRISDLTFRVHASEDKGICWGWMFSLDDSNGDDYIYPVNPPLRFNPSQLLGCGYGQTARESLKEDRALRFLLDRQDYDRLDPLLTNALWPYNAPNPDRAAEEYLTALKKLRTGVVRVKILNFEVAPDDVIRSTELRVEFIAPSKYHFDSSLQPEPAPCVPNP